MCKLCDIDGHFVERHTPGYEAVKAAIKEGDMGDELSEYFSNLAQQYMPDAPKRRQRVDSNKARQIAERFFADFEASAQQATDDLVAGSTDTHGWALAIEDALTDLYLNGAAAAAGYIGKLDGTMLDDVQNKLFEQEDYLESFRQDLENQDPATYDADKIMRRVMRYAPSSHEVVERSLNKSLGRPELPFYPKEGTLCRHNCKCAWTWTTIDSKNGDWDAYYATDPAFENCEVCLAREVFCNPLNIRRGEILFPQGFNLDDLVVN